jgi:hypothetical protein
MDEETFTLLSDCAFHFDRWWQVDDDSQKSADDLQNRLNAAIQRYLDDC